MTKSEILEDIGYLKSVAEEGRNAPLLGGRIGLMWAVLLVPALIIHGLAAQGTIALPIENIGAIWMGYGLLGGLLSFVLVRGIKDQPGARNIANQVESVMWPVTAFLIFGYAIGIALGVAKFDLPHFTFNSIIPFAFALSAVNLAVLSKLTGGGFYRVAAMAAGLFMIASAVLMARAEVYFLAAAGVVLTGILPNILQMKNEANHG